MLEVGVDFNSVSANGYLRTSPAMSPGTFPDLVLGMWVRAIDGEGNSCSAKVVELTERLARLEPDWETWVDAP